MNQQSEDKKLKNVWDFWKSPRHPLVYIFVISASVSKSSFTGLLLRGGLENKEEDLATIWQGMALHYQALTPTKNSNLKNHFFLSLLKFSLNAEKMEAFVCACESLRHKSAFYGFDRNSTTVQSFCN